MPVKKELVINTGPLIALVAATGGLEILPFVFARIIVPPEVKQEIHAGGTTGFAVKEFNHSTFLHVPDQPTRIPDYLRNSLDLGEASVIQLEPVPFYRFFQASRTTTRPVSVESDRLCSFCKKMG